MISYVHEHLNCCVLHLDRCFFEFLNIYFLMVPTCRRYHFVTIRTFSYIDRNYNVVGYVFLNLFNLSFDIFLLFFSPEGEKRNLFPLNTDLHTNFLMTTNKGVSILIQSIKKKRKWTQVLCDGNDSALVYGVSFISFEIPSSTQIC